MSLTLLWQWRYHTLQVDLYCKTVEEAVSHAHYAIEENLAAFERIEVFDDDGSYRLIERDEFERLRDPLLAAEDRAYEARRAIHVVAKVEILSPVYEKNRTEWTTYSTFTDRERAQTVYDELAPHLGERVRLVDLP